MPDLTLPEFFALQMQAFNTMTVEDGWTLMKANGAVVKPIDTVIIVALHKARVECTMVDLDLRLESVEWLRARNYTRRGGIPLPPPGVEPY